MKVTVLLFGNLVRLLPPGASGNSALISVGEGQTVDQMLDQLGVPQDSRGYVTLNGERADLGAPLREADEVRVMVPLCGG